MLGSTPWPVVAVLVGVALTLRCADWLYHRDSEPVLRMIGLRARGDGPAAIRRPLDTLFAPLPFLWAWCDIAAAVLVVRRAHGALLALGLCALALFVAARLRFLQEVGHTAVHGGLGRSRRWQYALADVLAHAPTFRPDAVHRFETHVRQHHLHVNEPGVDPNINRFASIGFVPTISANRFRAFLGHPFTPAGVRETARSTVANATKNTSGATAVTRAVATAATVALFLLLGGPLLLLVGYVVPLLLVYPFFSWISVLVEHRWFVACAESDRRQRECVLGRPTAYPGVGGWILSRAMFPASDRFHLAHSLYPSLRWNYLPAVDRALRAANPAYGQYGSVGLLVRRSTRPSALSELRDRMAGLTTDLAGWSLTLAERDLPTGDIPVGT